MPARHFLGWDDPLLDVAAEWLCHERGDSLDRLLIALPASRAVRGLEARLARLRGPSARPPRVLTAGALTDELLRVEAPVAGRMARTLAWQRALQELSEQELARLVPRPPAAGDLAAWTRLAESIRTLFGELAADGRRFEDVPPRLPALAGEAARWRALAAAQDHMERLLSEAGLADPHLARLDALATGALDEACEVVLVGLIDLNGLQRGVLQALGERVTALVFAPAELADDFDALGCLDVERWNARTVPLTLERWRVVDRPEDQARAALAALSQAPEPRTPDTLRVGMARPELAPYLQRRFRQAGVALRDAAGAPLEESAPARLLSATARALDGWRASDHAALVRHPDLERALRDGADGEPLAALDAYQRQHVPARVGAEWLGSGKRGAPRRALLEAQHGRLLELLGELAQPGPRPLPKHAAPIRAFLTAVYERAPLDEPDRRPEQHALAGALARIGRTLDELEALPAGLAPTCGPPAALAFLARALRGQRVPPPPFDAGVPTIELLGWLELLLDDARAIAVTGFEEGGVPEAVRGDAFLPDGLRGELGLADGARRGARDAYAIEALLRSHEEVTFVTGRRSASNDPQAPSRLAFHCPPEEALRRVQHVLRAGADRPRRPAEPEASPRRELPRRLPVAAPETWPVTAFGEFLRSPYLYYLRYVLRVETVGEEARELDGGVFGDLAHTVLERFGRGELRDSTDAERIAQQLSAELARAARARLGEAPAPAVALQLEQLEWRLGRFAARHAERARAGWRVHAVEWSPATGTVALDVDGAPVRLSGRIDRIDRHATTGAWAIFDYKTGDSAKLEPAKAHRARDGAWRDLQLPLYCLLAAELEMEALPELGYARLGKDEASIGFRAVKGWDEDVIEAAQEEARRVVRAVRAGEVFEPGSPPTQEPVLLALLGHGLLEAGDEDDGGEEEA